MSDEWQVTSIIVCDDICSAAANKDTLVGVYGGDIAVHDFPAEFRIAIWAEVLLHTSRRCRLELQVRGDNSKSVAWFSIDFQENQPETIVITERKVSMQKPGALNIFMRLDGDELRLIKTKKVLAA